MDDRWTSDRVNPYLRYAAIERKCSILAFLLKHPKADPSFDDNILLRRFISEYRGLDVINCLLDSKKVDPSFPDNAAIGIAYESGRLNIVERLLQDDRVISNLSVERLQLYQKCLNEYRYLFNTE